MSKTDAEIYADAMKRRWPYVDGVPIRPLPVRIPPRRKPDAPAMAPLPPGPRPLTPGEVCALG